MIKLITVCSHPEYAGELIMGAQLNGWDLVVIQSDWLGFGTKIIKTVQYLKDHPEITQFVFCDAYDVVVMGTPAEFLSKINQDEILFSAERGVWPPTINGDWYKNRYEHGFNYLNSGLYYAPSVDYLNMMEDIDVQYDWDDQECFTKLFLSEGYGIRLDTPQRVFNSHSFIAEGEYCYENGRVKILGNEPVFIHSNGRTVDEKLNHLLCKA